MKKHSVIIRVVTSLLILNNSFAQKTEPSVVEITSRLSAQKDVASDNQIIDDTFIVVGNRPPEGKVSRDTKNMYLNEPVYHFEATGKANRIEFTTCFGAEKDLKKYSKEELHNILAIKDAYIHSDQGAYGDEITYEWNSRFLEPMTSNSGGIFAQWHGRPDRTLVKTPEGKLKKISPKEFTKLLETMYFDNNIGKNRQTKKPNGWKVDGSAGGPIAAFHFREDYMYLIVRSEANRQSDPSFKVKPKPGKHLNKTIGRDGKTGSIAFEMRSNEVPINEWIQFKAIIKYSKYSSTEDKVIESGGLQLWMNGKKVADWKGDIGKNDELGPYFKFGIYKPGKAGFKVDCNGFKQSIKK